VGPQGEQQPKGCCGLRSAGWVRLPPARCARDRGCPLRPSPSCLTLAAARQCAAGEEEPWTLYITGHRWEP